MSSSVYSTNQNPSLMTILSSILIVLGGIKTQKLNKNKKSYPNTKNNKDDNGIC